MGDFTCLRCGELWELYDARQDMSSSQYGAFIRGYGCLCCGFNTGIARVETTTGDLPIADRVDRLLRGPESFRDWLDLYAPDAVVGYARSDRPDAASPLARFLYESTGEELCVGGINVSYDEAHLTDLPIWARCFEKVMYDTAPDTEPGPVTAAEARRYLEAALEQPLPVADQADHRPPLFDPGHILATPGARDLLARAAARDLLARHLAGDWGNLTTEARELNDHALKVGGSLVSAYPLGDDLLWVITTADRRLTTITIR